MAENCWEIIKKYKHAFKMEMNLIVGLGTALIFLSIVVVTELTGRVFYSVLNIPISCFISLILIFALIPIAYHFTRKGKFLMYYENSKRCLDEYFTEGSNEFQNLITGKYSSVINYKGENFVIVPRINNFIILKKCEKTTPIILGMQTSMKLKSGMIPKPIVDNDFVFSQSKLYTRKKYRGKSIWGKSENDMKLVMKIVDYLHASSMDKKILGINSGVFKEDKFLIFTVQIPESKREFVITLNAILKILKIIENA